MDINKICAQLEAQKKMIGQLLTGLTPEEAAWKPQKTTWSIVETLQHLVFEERFDFRWMLDHMLHNPQAPWPTRPDLSQAVPEKSLTGLAAAFEKERDQSIIWLKALPDEIEWNKAVEMPWEEPLTTGDMLASWLAHDLLHLRQLVECRYAILAKAQAAHSLAYAGKF